MGAKAQAQVRGVKSGGQAGARGKNGGRVKRAGSKSRAQKERGGEVGSSVYHACGTREWCIREPRWRGTGYNEGRAGRTVESGGRVGARGNNGGRAERAAGGA